MYGSMAYQGYATRDRTRTLFGQTMLLVAMTAGFFALGAYLGRNLSHTTRGTRRGEIFPPWRGSFSSRSSR